MNSRSICRCQRIPVRGTDTPRMPRQRARSRSRRATVKPAGTTFVSLACAALLAGCGASVNNSLQSGVTPTAERASAGLAQGAGQAGGRSGPSSQGGQTASVAESVTSVTTPGNAAYKIGPQDVLEISVFKVPDLSKSVQVADVGTVNLPLVGEIRAAGKTAREIELDLTEKLGAKYLQSPQVTVYVKEYNSQRVTVEGAVKKPGVYPIRGKTTLIQSIAMAEGLDNASASSNVVVFRQVNGKRTAARFDLDEIRAGRGDDPVMRPGDVVVADVSTTKVVLNTLLRVPMGAFVPLL